MSEEGAEPLAHWGRIRPERGESPRSGEADDDAEAFAHCLSTPEGRRMLAILRKRTIEKRARPNAPESELRELEAQRSLVFQMEIDRDKGFELIAKRAKATS